MNVFVPATFKTDYPQFNTLSDPYLTNVFNNEAVVLGRKGISLFDDAGKQLYWAEVVLAHILTISGNGVGSGATGRIAQAVEGSVQGQFENMGTIGSAWWDLTPYGQKYWQLIKTRGGATYFSFDENNLVL
jgi:hypothetical protein